MGRPSSYSDEIADEICDRLSDGFSLVQISKRDEMPHLRTINRWIADNEAFRHKYARAKEIQAEHFAYEIIDIADDDSRDDGSPAAVQRARLKVDARKWLMAKMAPKKYGDSLAVTGANQGPIRVENLTPEQRAAQAVALVDETFGPVIGVSGGTKTISG